MVILQIEAKIWGPNPTTVWSKMTESYALQLKYKLNQRYGGREM